LGGVGGFPRGLPYGNIAAPIRGATGHAGLETNLYAPIKNFLEGLGYSCKGEVGGCDIVGLKGGEPPVVVICELKMRFNLELVLQAVDRAASADEVWLAAELASKGRGTDARFRNLCRRLGFGMLGVDAKGAVEVIVSPVAPAPRRDPKRRSRLVEEHRRRKGDPAKGGMTRRPVMTAYRQRALACAAALASGPQRTRALRSEIPDATKILYHNVYGWFAPVSRGVYALTEAGRGALQIFAN
jgi:hypothetical protein